MVPTESRCCHSDSLASHPLDHDLSFNACKQLLINEMAVNFLCSDSASHPERPKANVLLLVNLYPVLGLGTVLPGTQSTCIQY
jgi:hypothetical protein